jgi:hypothetical protein
MFNGLGIRKLGKGLFIQIRYKDSIICEFFWELDFFWYGNPSNVVGGSPAQKEGNEACVCCLASQMV